MIHLLSSFLSFFSLSHHLFPSLIISPLLHSSYFSPLLSSSLFSILLLLPSSLSFSTHNISTPLPLSFHFISLLFTSPVSRGGGQEQDRIIHQVSRQVWRDPWGLLADVLQKVLHIQLQVRGWATSMKLDLIWFTEWPTTKLRWIFIIEVLYIKISFV